MMRDPFEAFHADHQAIRGKLRALEHVLDAAMNRDRADGHELDVFREVLLFLGRETDEHMRREEHALLPVLEAKIGRRGTLIDVIAYDHEEVRREIAKLGEAFEALSKKAGEPHRAELHELNRHGIFLVQYLSLHMAKEDSSLAETARQALGDEGLREIARRLEGAE